MASIAVRSDFVESGLQDRIGARPLRRADIELQRAEAGADYAYVIERIDINLLRLVDVLVHINIDVGNRSQPRQPGIIAATNSGHCLAVELAACGEIVNHEVRHGHSPWVGWGDRRHHPRCLISRSSGRG